MGKRTFTVLIEKDEDGIFVASVPSLKGCYTQAKTMDELLARIQEAIELSRVLHHPPNKINLNTR